MVSDGRTRWGFVMEAVWHFANSVSHLAEGFAPFVEILAAKEALFF